MRMFEKRFSSIFNIPQFDGKYKMCSPEVRPLENTFLIFRGVLDFELGLA